MLLSHLSTRNWGFAPPELRHSDLRMVLDGCAFDTERLSVGGWHSIAFEGSERAELADVVAGMLTPAVTRSLPGPWSGGYTVDRARGWIRERDDEGAALLVLDRSSRHPVGLVLLFEEHVAEGQARGPVDVRLGYLFAEDSWGKGFASELVAGFVGWCRDHEVASIAGGVADDNLASARVLTKNGFQQVTAEDAVGPGERLYRVDLAR